MYLSRRKFLKQIAKTSVLSAVLPSFTMNSCAKAKRPNILFIMSDDHGYQAISAYSGGKLNQTPNIDRLAEEGAIFENNFCTNSICAPSRATVLTGKYTNMNGQIDNRVSFDGTQVTFPKLFRKAGYQTALIGKWHLRSDPTGFDFWSILPGQGSYYNPDFIEMGKHVRIPGYVTDITTDKALEWLDKRDKNRPFCMMLHHKAPHRNWKPAPRHLHKYDDVDFPLPDNYFDHYKTREKTAGRNKMKVDGHALMGYDLKIPPKYTKNYMSEKEYIRDSNYWKYTMQRFTKEQRAIWDKAYQKKIEHFVKTQPKGKELAKWKFKRYMEDYLGCIAAVDENIGRVLDYLDKNNLADNTLVIYTSDQGFYLGEHGWFDKRFMYEESFRMPLLMRYPKEIKEKTKVMQLTNNADFAPTFLDFAGLEIPAEMQGESFRQLFQNPKVPWRKEIYYHYYEHPSEHNVSRHYGIRSERYKLIHFYYDVNVWEFYDLQKDPHEMTNQYENPEYSDIIAEMKIKLKQLQEKYKDTKYMDYLPQPKKQIKHKAVGSQVTLKNPCSEKYKGSGKNSLTDGHVAPKKNATAEARNLWTGFETVDLEAVVDFGKDLQFSSIATGFLQNINSWIFMPKKVEYFVSEDGKNFQKLGEVKNPKSINQREEERIDYKLDFDEQKAKYIKVIAKNQKICPPWHVGAGGPAWLFADEIIVK